MISYVLMVALGLWGQAAPPLHPPDAPAPQSLSPASPAEGQTQYCADIALADPQLEPVAKICNFALSPRYLPNFICRETVTRFRGSSKRARWKKLDVVAAEVRFEHGTGTDRYYNVTINDRPIHWDSDMSSKDLGEYLAHVRPGGFWGYGEFGGEIVFVFTARSQARFKLRDGANRSLGPGEVFDFHIDRAHSQYLLNSGEMYTHPALDGSLWVDRASSKLLRIELNSTEIQEHFPVSASSVSTDFGDVSIRDEGQFQLPVAAEATMCERETNHCYRNALEFHDCRKFGSESHIRFK